MTSFLYILFFSVAISSGLQAQTDSTRNLIEKKIIESYGSLLAGKVTSTLLANHKIYGDYPNKYWQFLNETLLDNWDFDATTRALIGNEIFNSLSLSQFKKLSRSLEVTLIRYAFESLSFYGEQKLNLIEMKLNEDQTFAWLKINMESPMLPDIHLDLLLKRTNFNKWKGVDFRFKGITYTNIMKKSYRKDFENLKLEGLLTKLNNKNKLFFKKLCQGKVNYVNPRNPPCM